MSVTRPVQMTTAEAEEIERRLRSEVIPRQYQHIGNSGNGKTELYKIITAIAGCLCLVVLCIFGWVAVHVIGQQDDTAGRLAVVETKLDLLIGSKNGK
jgi:ATP-dependent protease HslVU (ClpYQ) ATPase subunit